MDSLPNLYHTCTPHFERAHQPLILQRKEKRRGDKETGDLRVRIGKLLSCNQISELLFGKKNKKTCLINFAQS